MARVLAAASPKSIVRPAAVSGAFPKLGGTFTSADGAIVVPSGALERWFAYRATRGVARREVVIFGDSTTFGSGPTPSYSWVQRLRDRAVSWGMADGGKGIFAGAEYFVGYDLPEITGFAIEDYQWQGSTDAYDSLSGAFLFDDGAVANRTATLKFRSSAFRLFYVARSNTGLISYSVDGGTAVQVNTAGDGNALERWVYGTGYDPTVVHTMVVTNLAVGNTACHIALAPINATGLVLNKQAISGNTINNIFHGGAVGGDYTAEHHASRYQAPLGLVPTFSGSPTGADAYAAHNVLDTTHPAGERIQPLLAVFHLGFNDLSSQATTNYTLYTEAIKKFAASCRGASCDGMVLSGQLPYNASWPTYGAAIFAAMKAEALAQGLAFVDLFYPVAGPSLSYAGGTSNPHLSKAQYVAQADYLWDHLLGLAV